MQNYKLFHNKYYIGKAAVTVTRKSKIYFTQRIIRKIVQIIVNSRFNLFKSAFHFP